MAASLGVTGVIIARNEAKHLGPCLDALAWTDARLVVLDTRTTDRSAAIAESRDATVVHREFHSFPTQRNAALQLARETTGSEWVLFIDADERVTPALAAEVRSTTMATGPDAPVGYWIPRRNYIWGGWIRHGGWSPDYQLRLLQTNRARYDEDRDVHEVVLLDGNAGQLMEPLLHYNYDRLGQFLTKQDQYTRLEARRLARQGLRARPHNFLLQPLREFRRRYLQLEGRRDGWRGLLLATFMAWYTFRTYVELGRQGG